MEDHHVDRLGVEVWQHMKLTSTNSSIGLIVLINQCLFAKRIKQRLVLSKWRSSAARLRTSMVLVVTAFLRERDDRKERVKKLTKDLLCKTFSLPAWWPWRGVQTRSHPELGR